MATLPERRDALRALASGTHHEDDDVINDALAHADPSWRQPANLTAFVRAFNRLIRRICDLGDLGAPAAVESRGFVEQDIDAILDTLISPACGYENVS